MTIAMQPIYTRTISGTSTGLVTFNNIPQTFTDLVVKASIRISQTGNLFFDPKFYFNNDTSLSYAQTQLYGTGSSVNTGRDATSTTMQLYVNSDSSTASTFSNSEIYIPNYGGSIFKSCYSDSVTESNSTSTVLQFLEAYSYRSTSPITRLDFNATGALYFMAGSTFTLYGITKG
jgi:hypothetical protein